MLYLLDKDVKTVKWNGIPLHEASSAIVKEETNGDFYITVRYPITDSSIYQLIKEDMLIKAPTPVLGPQLFRIKKPVENDDSLDITAFHITDDVMKRSINPVSVVGQSCAMALSQMVQNAKTDLGNFSFTSDIMDSRTFNTTDAETLYSVLLDGKHSIVGTWEGELVRDNFALSIKRSRGADRGVVITTHKNLKSYQRTKNSQSVVTRIHAKSTFKPDGAEDEVTLRVTVDSPLINSYPYINEKDYENNNAETVEDLRKWAEAKFTNEGIDKISDAIEIEAYELDGQVIHLGDTVNIKSRKHDVDLYKKAIAYEYNALTEEYISITFDDNPGVGGSGVSSGLSNAADAILGASATAQDVAVQRAVKNANAAFDAEFDKRAEKIYDGIEQAQAEAERYADAIKQEIDTEIAQVNQSMQSQEQEHDREVANILSKTQSVESLANQAKADAANAIARANQVKTEAIADARAQVATVNQALNTAKTELQSAIASADQKARDSQASATALRNDLNLQASKILAQAQAQTALTSRVTTVETLADGTRSTVAELSKTVSKATGDITSVTSRTKTVEDTLSQTRTQYEALTQTVNMQTGQIDSINRKTADLQSGIDGVTERFESLRIEDNLLLNSSFNQNLTQWQGTGVTIVGGKARITGEFNKTKDIYQSIKSQTANDDVSQVYIASISVKVSNYAAGSINPYLALYISGIKNDSAKTWFGATYLTPSRLEAVNNKGIVQFTTTFKVNVPRSQIDRIYFHIYARDFTGEVEFEKVSLRRGNIDLGWQASPEDLRSEIATYKRTAEESSAELSRQIQLADGKAVEAKTYAQQTAEGFKTRLESLETYKDGESTRASQYFTASRAETAKQLSAERAAIATNYVAKSTYDENVRGTTLKLNEIKSTADTAKQNLATYQNTVDRKLEELTSSTQTLDGKINTASAKVDTVAGQIRTEIGTVEAKIPTEAGGRNYILKSQAEISSTGRWVSKPFNLSSDLLSNLSKIKTVTISCDVEGINVSALNSRKRYGLACSVEINGVVNYWEVWQTQDTTKKRISQTFTVPEGKVITKFHSPTLWIQAAGDIKVSNPKIEFGRVPTDHTLAPEDFANELSSVKTTITQTASGVEQLSTSLATTDNKVTTAEAKIRQLISDVSSKVSQTDYNTLTGRVDDAETAITQNATEISKRLTKTQVDKAITDKGFQTASQVDTAIAGKGYQTKSDVDNNITGRGYITSSALQPYALSTTVQNLVQETAGSFERQITETRGLIPTEVNQNLFDVVFSDLRATGGASFVQSDDGWIEVTIKNRWSGFHWYYSDDINPSKKQYVVSYEAYLVDTVAETARLESDFGSPDQLTLINKTPKRYTVVLNRPANIYNYINFVCNSSETGKKFRIRNIKLEEGIVATPYIAPFPTTVLFNAVKDTVDAHKRLIGNGDSISQAIQSANKFERSISSGGDVYQAIETAKGLVTEVSGTNGLKIQVSQLAGSWAVQNLTSSGQILNQINLLANGTNRIDGRLTHITGQTLIDNGVIINAMIGNLDAGKIKTGTLDAARIRANSIDGSKIVFDQAFLNKMTANEALFKQLFAQSAFITSVQAVAVSAKQIAGGIAKALNGGMDVNFDESKINFYTNVAAIRRIYTGHPTQFIKFETEGNYSRTIIGSNRNGGEVFNSATFAGIVVENTNNINTEDNVRIYGDNTLLRHAQGDVGWNINSVTQRIVPANMNAESEIWSKHFVAPDKNSKPVRLDTAVAALWDIWNHIIYNNFEFNAALRTHIKARRDNWKFELNL
ncbi:phage tail spike protein [Streptococcus suis]|uniref:phage tail spike protein n=1 Tax=Streptococcus suis TaxID=1307 RepID=UPI001EE97364|nr:phage tail spike protein [Streptococcus suis]